MITKKKCQEIIDKEAPWVMRKLKLSKKNLDIVVMHSQKKEHGIPPYPHASAFCLPTNTGLVIGIYYDQQKSQNEAFYSLVHELIHAKMHPIKQFIKRNKKKEWFAEEENVVHRLEQLVAACFERKKL